MRDGEERGRRRERIRGRLSGREKTHRLCQVPFHFLYSPLFFFSISQLVGGMRGVGLLTVPDRAVLMGADDD